MRKHNILVISNNTDMSALISKNLAIRGCVTQAWTGLENPEEVAKVGGLILTDDLYSHWSGVQHPDKIAAAIRAKNIKTPIFLACLNAAEESLAKYRASNLFNEVFPFAGHPSVSADLEQAINKHLGPRPLHVGVSGVGNFGYTLLGEIKNAPFVDSVGVHSEFYKADYSNLWKLLRVEGSNMKGFNSLDEMVAAIPNLDCLGIFAGQHGQMAPAKGKSSMDRSLGFFDTMPILHPRLLELKKLMEAGKFKGFVIIESGPQEIIMQYMVEEMGFSPEKILGVSPDGFRARYELRKDLIQEWETRYFKMLSSKTDNPEVAAVLNALKQEYERSTIGAPDKNPAQPIGGLERLEGLDLEGVSARGIAEQYIRIREMSTNDIKLKILGGRSWPIPTDAQSTVFNQSLFEVLPQMKTELAREDLIKRIKQWGWLQAEIVGKNGKPYFDSPDEFKKLLEDMSYCVARPHEYWFGYNPELKLYMQGPLNLDMVHHEARWDGASVPVFDTFQARKIQEGIDYQRKTSKQRIAEYRKLKTESKK